MDIWSACKGRAPPTALAGELIRIVESQEQIATTGLVDDLSEQALLEEMLEGSKPAARPGAHGLHYLLATPFRYPPLRHGSRFGSRFEPSLFYGSRRLPTALAETAYYRFVFWFGMAKPPPSGKLLTQHTEVRAHYAAHRGLRLQEPPFSAYEAQLRDPGDYTHTQRLGTAMRERGIVAFEYVSARDQARACPAGTPSPGTLALRDRREHDHLLGHNPQRGTRLSFD
jgi:hypothetical protein